MQERLTGGLSIREALGKNYESNDGHAEPPVQGRQTNYGRTLMASSRPSPGCTASDGACRDRCGSMTLILTQLMTLHPVTADR